ncbi:hypothetical protein TNCT_32271 [Trichonephila clavata]|uniref:Uncharacterized protein n=1 Tax=Trichonephila clavata TaxID=2740835 RepID=A0A8X6IDZ8_TRICU|nr:hypothetical protein TNCT_32271 [Trichonephila clavata]
MIPRGEKETTGNTDDNTFLYLKDLSVKPRFMYYILGLKNDSKLDVMNDIREFFVIIYICSGIIVNKIWILRPLHHTSQIHHTTR